MEDMRSNAAKMKEEFSRREEEHRKLLEIALEEVLGIVNPAAPSIGTITIVVLFPGTPPIQCLSKIGFLLILSVLNQKL